MLLQLLLGQKYGTVMLPRVVADDEFEALRRNLQNSERDFLDTWYLRDENVIPPVRVLQPRYIYAKYSAFPLICCHTLRLFLRYSKQGIIWGVVESKLRELLQESAIVCVANQQLSDEQAKKYFFSGLQKNIPRKLKRFDI